MNIMASYWHWNLLCLLCAVFVAWLVPTRAVMDYCSEGSLNCTVENATKIMTLNAGIPDLPDFPCFNNYTANLTCCEQETTTEAPTTTVEETTTESATTESSTTESTTPTSTDTTTETTETTETTTVLASSKETLTESALTPPTPGDDSTPDSTTPDSTTLSDIDGPFTITSSTATASQPMSSTASDHSLAFTEASSSIALTSPVYNTTTQEISNYTTGENTTTADPTPPPGKKPLSTVLIMVIILSSVTGTVVIAGITKVVVKKFKPTIKVGPEQDVPLTTAIAPAENVENESGRDRSISTGSQAGDTSVLIKPQVVPEVKRTIRIKKRGSRGVTQLKPDQTIIL
ncbi:uncharacterized protein [Asterias amurensis]|uniref:uncharacterized protein isoform X3 n=1 Tax=Asterias amurensis TaxID=7602 RepID=UPI003AB31240